MKASKLRLWPLLLGTWLGVSAFGCGHSQSPRQTLRQYSAAISDGRIEDAYKLLSLQAKRTISLEAFRQLVKENPQEVKELARNLARPGGKPVVRARVLGPDGEELVLVLEGGEWKLAAENIDLYSQLTPKLALKAFVRAYEAKHFDILMRFVPKAKLVDDDNLPALDAKKLKTSWEGPQKSEMDAIVEALRSALKDPELEELGDTATLRYGQGSTMQLVREEGVWKVSTFQ